MTNTIKLVCCVIFISCLQTSLSAISPAPSPSDHISLAPSSSGNISPASSPSGNEAGSVVKVGGLLSYVSGSPQSNHAVILGSDVYGFAKPNIRSIADKVAAAGFYAVVPDFFRGDPLDPLNPKKPKDMWMKLHPPTDGVKASKQLIRAMVKQGVRGIGFAGFCWGGKVAVELAKTHSIKAAVLIHPSFVTRNDIKEVKVPIAVLGAEIDSNLPVSLLQEFEKSLKSKPKIANQVKVYPEVQHGFALKYNLTDTKAVKVAYEAHEDMIKWFTKYVN